jgi:hypothetical protein
MFGKVCGYEAFEFPSLYAVSIMLFHPRLGHKVYKRISPFDFQGR